MAGFLTYTIGGAGIFLIGATESIISTTQTTNTSSHSPRSRSTRITFTLISLITFLFISNSLISITSALKSHDQTGVVLQLQVISISALFLLFSILGVSSNTINSFQIPSHILNTLCLFGFIEEFFIFYIQKKDPDGIENRYYDLLLVPVTVCIVSTLLELKDCELGGVNLNYARFGRGVGLVMQGMWFVQMGFSFYSGLMTDGCFMKAKSRGNFTIRCKGHPEFHRARAIATLQFNCHLALVVCFVVGGYSLVSRRFGEVMRYKPIGAEMVSVSGAQFTLESDDEGEGDNNGNGNAVKEKSVVVIAETGVNGFGSHH